MSNILRLRSSWKILKYGLETKRKKNCNLLSKFKCASNHCVKEGARLGIRRRLMSTRALAFYHSSSGSSAEVVIDRGRRRPQRPSWRTAAAAYRRSLLLRIKISYHLVFGIMLFHCKIKLFHYKMMTKLWPWNTIFLSLEIDYFLCWQFILLICKWGRNATQIMRLWKLN